MSNATKLVKPNEKPKEDPTKPQFYNIMYILTTFFKKKHWEAIVIKDVATKIKKGDAH